jgi:hypothetical protein
MTTCTPSDDCSNIINSLESIELSSDTEFIEAVQGFFVDSDSPELNVLQQDGANAIVDLALDYEINGSCNDVDLLAHVIGRLSDIQVRDYALGSHNDENLSTYLAMWHNLTIIAPTGFIAPVACLFASLVYENGDSELALKAIERALRDDPSYSLAILLRRVFKAGWPPRSFSAMRAELHPKIVATIFHS